MWLTIYHKTRLSYYLIHKIICTFSLYCMHSPHICAEKMLHNHHHHLFEFYVV